MKRYGFNIKKQLAVALLAIVLLVPGGAYGAGKADRVDAPTEAEIFNEFFDQIWGAQPAGVPGAMYMAGLDNDLAVYTAVLDLSNIIGAARACANPLLIFAQEGLVQIRIDIASQDSDQVKEHLTRLLGQPNPVIYERMPGYADLEKTEWLVGENTKLKLVSRCSEASVVISKRDYFLWQELGFAARFAAALEKQAREYERLDQTLAASSIYQELLSNVRAYQSFTPAARERLATCSRRPEAVEYLGQKAGFAFSYLKNQFTASNGQQWIRIEIDSNACEQMLLNRPDNASRTDDGAANLRSVLCRVRFDEINKKCLVTEQIWLDGSDRIIGQWSSSDAAWPVPFINRTCETFMEKWLTPAKPVAGKNASR